MTSYYDGTYGSPYPQGEIMMLRAKMRHLVLNTNGKLMDDVRYKTGIGRYACHVRRHNNKWQKSALNSLVQTNYCRVRSEQDQYPELHTGYPLQSNAERYLSRMRQNNQLRRFTECSDVENDYLNQSLEELYGQSYGNRSNQSSTSLNEYKKDQPESSSSDSECFSSKDQRSSAKHGSSSDIYINIDDDESLQRTPSQLQHEKEGENSGKLTFDAWKRILCSKSTPQSIPVTHAKNPSQVNRKRRECSNTLSVETDSNNSTSQSALQDNDNKINRSVPKKMKKTHEDNKNEFNWLPKENTITKNQKLQTLKCDLCEFFVPLELESSESQMVMMKEHFQQQKHNSASLVELTKDEEGKTKLICVLKQSSFLVPSASHICRTNSLVPVCPKKNCDFMFKTIWLCAKHYQVFHDNAEDSCYGLGKVIERKIIPYVNDCMCEKCEVIFPSTRKLNRHWKSSDHLPHRVPVYPEKCFHFCPYCQRIFSTFQLCRHHIIAIHKPTSKKIAIEVIYIQFPTSHLQLPQMKKRSLRSEIDMEVCSLKMLRDEKYCEKGRLSKGNRKKLRRKIKEMKNLKRKTGSSV